MNVLPSWTEYAMISDDVMSETCLGYNGAINILPTMPECLQAYL